MRTRFPAILFCAAIACAGLAADAGARQSQQTQSQPSQSQSQQQRTLWIAKFTCEAKAPAKVASAVAATQHNDFNALLYDSLLNGKLFSSVNTFETLPTQPPGTWSLSANEVEFNGGSAAERAVVGYGTGRASITMEYRLADPSGNVVWTQKIKTKPWWWASSGAMGAVQNQGGAEDEQAQKLTEVLYKYFGVAPAKKKYPSD